MFSKEYIIGKFLVRFGVHRTYAESEMQSQSWPSFSTDRQHFTRSRKITSFGSPTVLIIIHFFFFFFMGGSLLCISFIICLIFQVWFFSGKICGSIRACKPHYLQSSVIERHRHLVQMLLAWIPLYVSRHMQQSSFLAASAEEPVGKVVSSKDLMLWSFSVGRILSRGHTTFGKVEVWHHWHCWDCTLHIPSRRTLQPLPYHLNPAHPSHPGDQWLS